MPRRLITLPNCLTVFRIAVLPLLAIAIAMNEGVWACIILVIAGLSDIADGWIARKYQQETAVGKLLDPVADKVLLCVAVIFLVARNDAHHLSPTLGTLLLAREFLVTGLRALAATEGMVIAAGQTGKLKTFTQFIGLGCIMVGGHPGHFPAHTVGVFSLWISVVLSYGSMVEYIRAAYRELKSKLG
jgi:CDP-diacylglycerol--glycerol-3-phosphate 3-phosphatidyltransferase